ncbi:tetratricopeptide repeat protein [Streptomyces sp. DSM 15324]|uniref:tetratricopeptide repeat protein n=1 Tax=Streptomyces sp. DSM 15324 TaxID=1739111 RepID=UPI00131E20F6|nr:tetratricopeptide repeat protein [Streptomyces sp. DSM 15324]
MKRRQLLVVLSGAAAVATGLLSWSVLACAAALPDAGTPSAKRTPPSADALLQAGIAAQQNHDPQGASRFYGVVLALDPRNKAAWYNLGVIAHQDGRTADARRAYEKALKIDPAFPSALYNEALLLKAGDPDLAMGLLERAVGADPSAATAHLHLGDLWVRKNRKQEAAEEYRSAVAADPALLSQVPEPFRTSLRPAPAPSTAGSPR